MIGVVALLCSMTRAFQRTYEHRVATCAGQGAAAARAQPFADSRRLQNIHRRSRLALCCCAAGRTPGAQREHAPQGRLATADFVIALHTLCVLWTLHSSAGIPRPAVRPAWGSRVSIWALQCASSCRMLFLDGCDAQEQGSSPQRPAAPVTLGHLPATVLHMRGATCTRVLHMHRATSTRAMHRQALARPSLWVVLQCRTSLTG